MSPFKLFEKKSSLSWESPGEKCLAFSKFHISIISKLLVSTRRKYYIKNLCKCEKNCISYNASNHGNFIFMKPLRGLKLNSLPTLVNKKIPEIIYFAKKFDKVKYDQV